MKVILIGNYSNDQQESMLRFHDLLATRLAQREISVETLSPAPWFGRFIRGATGLAKFLGYLDKFAIFPARIKSRIRRLDTKSVIHICDHSNSIYTPLLVNHPHIVTCHDLLAARSAAGEIDGCHVRASGRLYQRLILRGLKAAQRVACVSSATMRDLKRLTSIEPNRVNLIHNGLNYPYSPLSDSLDHDYIPALSNRFGAELAKKLQGGFVLHVGGNHWYKNRPGVLRIYARLCEMMPNPPKLIMAGKALTAELKSLIKENHLQDHVFELTQISNEDLSLLYCSASLFLFPSLEEGFGWPIIEAQACGCRVVIPDREPMNEIGGDAAKTFTVGHSLKSSNKFSAEAVKNGATAVAQVLGEAFDERSARIRRGLTNAAGFSANGMIESYVKLYQQLLSIREERSSLKKTVVCPLGDF